MPSMQIQYSKTVVPAHGAIGAAVYLVNEAPGPFEDASRIPSYGLQGANIFHSLRLTRVDWALKHERFVWPQSSNSGSDARQQRKIEFLETRKQWITCTNAYRLLPRPADSSKAFCPPASQDVESKANLSRIRTEITKRHRALLICGEFAYLACTGHKRPSEVLQFQKLDADQLQSINRRLGASFQGAWYMGHTRRWLMKPGEMVVALRAVAKQVGWTLNRADTRQP